MRKLPDARRCDRQSISGHVREHPTDSHIDLVALIKSICECLMTTGEFVNVETDLRSEVRHVVKVCISQW